MKTTVITSKGTTTIPKEVRDSLGLVPGSSLTFRRAKSGKYFIDPVDTIDDIRSKNRAILSRESQSLKDYQSGDGFRAHAKRRAGES